MDVSNELISQLSQTRTKESDLLKQLLNFDSLIFELEQALKNKAYDPERKVWVVRGSPLVNDEGLTTIRGIITAHLNNVFIVSNFDDDDVNQICQNLGEDVIKQLALKYLDWEIDDRNLGIIYTLIINNVYAMMKGSFKEGIRELLKNVEKRETRILQQEPTRRRGILPSFSRGDED